MIQLTKEDIKECIEQRWLADALVQSLKSGWEEEFKTEIYKAMETAAKQAVKEYLDEYDGKRDIKAEVENYLSGLTKKEIVAMIIKDDDLAF